MFCIRCDTLICTDCKMGHHLHHKSQTLQDASQEAKGQLSRDKERIKKVVEDLEKKVAERSQDQSEFKDKKAAVECEIRQRHATIVEAADKYRDEALVALDQDCKIIGDSQSTALDTAQKNLEAAHKLQQSIDKAVESGEDRQLVMVAKEMRSGHGSQESVEKLAVEPLKVMTRPICLGDSPSDDAVFVRMKKFIGVGKQVQFSSSSPSKVNVKEEFTCGKEVDAVPFCVCPLYDGTLKISFDGQYNRKETCLVHVYPNGTEISCKSSADELASMQQRASGMFLGYERKRMSTCVKCHSKGYYCLTKYGKGQAHFQKIRVLTKKTLAQERCLMLLIACNHHRAVDINAGETMFVVVEEGSSADDRRQVKLFQRDHRQQVQQAASTYTSPVLPYQPADVCFFTLGAEEVLLIADELNDAIHVVKVEDKCMKFSHFLAPGCPLLLKPTALNTNTKGRLWVGCRGGRILTMEPLS